MYTHYYETASGVRYLIDSDNKIIERNGTRVPYLFIESVVGAKGRIYLPDGRIIQTTTVVKAR